MSSPAAAREGEWRPWVVAALVFVVTWRALAYLWPSSLIAIPDSLRAAIGFLGLLFLICGVWAWWVRPGRWTTVFLAYALGGAVHWGGSIGSSGAADAWNLALGLIPLALAFALVTETVSARRASRWAAPC